MKTSMKWVFVLRLASKDVKRRGGTDACVRSTVDPMNHRINDSSASERNGEASERKERRERRRRRGALSRWRKRIDAKRTDFISEMKKLLNSMVKRIDDVEIPLRVERHSLRTIEEK